MSADKELQINAYIDSELGSEERQALLAAAREDAELGQALCELRHTKELVQLAYDQPPGLRQPRPMPHRGRRALLATVAGLVALLAGFFGVTQLQPAEPNRFVMLDPNGLGAAPAERANDEMRIVVHLTDPDQTHAGELLDEVEALLKSYREEGRPLRIEVVGNGKGLGLLRQRLSAHKERIASLAEHYDNLTFVACQNTIERLRVEDGVEVSLLPEAQIVSSGVNYVAQRRRQGWAYIKV